MGKTFTHTTWQVKPGLESEFVERWLEWAEWSHRQGLRAHARLLRDVESPGTFVSFGPWETIAAVRTWRGESGYHERVARLQELVERFEPRTLEQVAEI
jgi:heme-degrading monooxygenase HmoA